MRRGRVKRGKMAGLGEGFVKGKLRAMGEEVEWRLRPGCWQE